MELLRALTLGYGAVLVVALAASLIAIRRLLGRIDAKLAAVRTALAAVRDRTRSLDDRFEPLRDRSRGTAAGFAEAEARLRRADQRLGALAEGPAPDRPTR